MITRDFVLQLQNVHADFIASQYERLALMPGNPEQIEIVQIGSTRVFLSGRSRLENRAIFTGNESVDELRQITALFEERKVTGYFELNAGNFYRSDPFSWRSEMLPALLELGYFPSDLRCVWYGEPSWIKDDAERPTNSIRDYRHDQAEAYIAARFAVEPPADGETAQERALIRQTFTDNWINFIGFEDERPVSHSQLFLSHQIGYLAWGYTRPELRRCGHHQQHVIARVKAAQAAGCDLIFTVTDFDVASSRSLQKLGFRLAYNYLLLIKYPPHQDEQSQDR